MVIESIFAGIVCIAMPLRAWRRYRNGSAVAPAARYITETLFLTGLLAALWWQHGLSPAALGLKPPSLRWVADVVVCVGAIAGVDWWMAERRVRQIQSSQWIDQPVGLAADALAGQQSGAPYVAVILVSAIWEEFFFRATIFALAPHTTAGILFAILAGSLLFGAHHLRSGPAGMMYSTGFGIAFALLFLATGNLFAVIAAHACGNLLTAFKWAPRMEKARQSVARPAPLFLG